MDFGEKMQRCNEYVEALEEEKRKIQVFQRELPLCLQLVTQAIEACRRELLSGATTTENMVGGSSECTDQTSSEGRPVLEEFIPLIRSCSYDNNNKNINININEKEDEELDNNEEECVKPNKKSEWLRSVQLWNNQSSPDPSSKEELPRKAKVTEVKRSEGGAFHPFQKEKSAGKSTSSRKSSTPPPNENDNVPIPPSVPASSTTAGGDDNNDDSGNNKKKEKESQRKQRRCWSPELHRRFLQSLQQLGGSHAATPKQIRELMKVDGLTNDEVKSHLQKYRLHTRRPASSSHNNPNNTQAPQFLVVGGIWVPPPEYATTSTPCEVPMNGIYTPIATPASQTSTALLFQRPENERLNSEERGCSHAHSNSPATSHSSSRTG
ncbi:hypothetical protein ACFE04_018757 [Oxalis oulophora]